MTRCINGWLLGVALAVVAATSPSGACPFPERWTRASASGELELVVEPVFGDEGAERRLRGSRLRLERVGDERTVIWETTSPELLWTGFVADDGDYVVTLGGEVTIRNSAGAVVRSLSQDELVSIAEQLDGADRRVIGLDATEEYLLVEIFRDENAERIAIASRRVQLMDGAVLDPPATPPGFALPPLTCAPPAELRVVAMSENLWQGCLAPSGDAGETRAYAYADGAFRIVEARSFGPGVDRWWVAEDQEVGSGPCERIHRDDALVSERCGPDVEPPE